MFCKICNGEMKQLFTSSYCPTCDEKNKEEVVMNPNYILNQDSSSLQPPPRS